MSRSSWKHLKKLGIAAAVAAAIVTTGNRTASAQLSGSSEAAVPSETILAYRFSPDEALGRTFSIMWMPSGGMSRPSPISGSIEICGKGPDGEGVLLATFDSTEVPLTESGCKQVELSGVSEVGFLATGGEWNIVVRRLGPPSGGTYSATVINRSMFFGRSISLMTTKADQAGALPEVVEGYSGRLELCVRTDLAGTDLHLLIDGNEVMRGVRGVECREITVSNARWATVTVNLSDWDVVLRRLP